jgi:hypothetical protein
MEPRQLLASTVSAIASGMTLKNLSDANGIPLNSTQVTIPFTGKFRIGVQSDITARGFRLNPNTGKEILTPISILSATRTADLKSLILTTGRLFPKGGRIFLHEGSIKNTDNKVMAAQTLKSKTGVSLNAFSLANRDFSPHDQSFYTTDIYTKGHAPTTASSAIPDATVTSDFTAFMDKKVAMGKITAATEATAIANYNSAIAKSMIPSANLRAALFSLYGTAAEPSINAIFGKSNATGKHFTLVDFSNNISAEFYETDLTRTNRLRTELTTNYTGEPFEALSTVLAQESMEQASSDGQDEEIFTNAIETMVWAQQLQVDPTVMNAGTSLVETNNNYLLAMLDSGRHAFSQIGIETAPNPRTPGGVFFGGLSPSSGGPYVSFEDFLRRVYIGRGFQDVSSPGNVTLQAILKNVTGSTKPAIFNQSLLDLLDSSQRVITGDLAMSLAAEMHLAL